MSYMEGLYNIISLDKEMNFMLNMLQKDNGLKSGEVNNEIIVLPWK